MRGRFHESELVETAPHPDPLHSPSKTGVNALTARGEREQKCRALLKNAHSPAPISQNNPTILPSVPTSIESAAGTLGRPGIVMTSPQIATTNSAPADSRTSRTGIT